MITIYGPSSSRDGVIRYVGKTRQRTGERLKRHLGNYYLRQDCYKTRWLKQELGDGFDISIEVVDSVHENEWQFWEKFWIRQYREWGHHLTNTADGGEGVTGDDIVRRRGVTRKARTKERRKEDWMRFNVQEHDDHVSGARICGHCQQQCHYKHSSVGLLLSSIHRALRENRKCPSCIGQGAYESSASLTAGGWNPKRGGNHGSENPFFGKKHKKESVQKAVATRKVALNIPDVVQMTLDGAVVNTFRTVREDARLTKVARNGIRGCCKNKPNYHTAGGFKWRYA